MSKPSQPILREVTEADLPFHYQIQREPDGFKMAQVRTRDEGEFYQHWRENVLSNPNVIIRTIAVDGEVAGDVTSFILENQRVVGYWIAQRFWGKGVATAALREFLLSHETRRPLSAFVALSNVASVRVLEKCGFRKVGQPALASDGVKELKLELN